MAAIESPDKITDVPKALIKNMIFLATSGFGVVVALAWNEFIKAGIPDSKIVTIPNAGHLSTIDSPEAFTHELELFFEGL